MVPVPKNFHSPVFQATLQREELNERAVTLQKGDLKLLTLTM